MEAQEMKGRKVTEKFSAARCQHCGARVGFEDGIRQDFCLCDRSCACCGLSFIPSAGRGSGRLCDGCIEEEIVETFSEEFLKSLSREQMSLLIRDISRRLE